MDRIRLDSALKNSSEPQKPPSLQRRKPFASRNVAPKGVGRRTMECCMASCIPPSLGGPRFLPEALLRNLAYLERRSQARFGGWQRLPWRRRSVRVASASNVLATIASSAACHASAPALRCPGQDDDKGPCGPTTAPDDRSSLPRAGQMRAARAVYDPVALAHHADLLSVPTVMTPAKARLPLCLSLLLNLPLCLRMRPPPPRAPLHSTPPSTSNEAEHAMPRSTWQDEADLPWCHHHEEPPPPMGATRHNRVGRAELEPNADVAKELPARCLTNLCGASGTSGHGGAEI